MCGDCQRRAETNPLRVLDCKVEADQPIIDALPSILDYLCDACRAHFDAVRQYLTDRGIEFEVRPRMVRGLDYYMRTTFEVVHGALGAQNSVLGGGRYDGLAESLGSKVHSPGIGFSIGEDRLVMGVEDDRQTVPLDLFIAALGDAAVRHAALLARDLRRAGLTVELSEAKLKRAMEIANKLAARFTLIVGDNEITAGRYTLKNMSTGEQSTLTADEEARASRPALPRPALEN
jgi:histidyl-tRNA synthetase